MPPNTLIHGYDVTILIDVGHSERSSREEELLWRGFVNIAKEKTGALAHVSKLNDGTYLCSLDGGLNSLVERI